MALTRGSGILMPIASLPSRYGIGTMGKSAYDFTDFLRTSGQTYWQILPLGPTGCGDSPYQSFSSFAGNPYLIDLDLLIADGLLTLDEVEAIDWGDAQDRVDYGKIYQSRFAVLALAKERGWERQREEIRAFEEENRAWLPDYALFMALKRHFGMKSWLEWEDSAARAHDAAALAAYRETLKEDMELFIYIQFLFFRQWQALRDYVHLLGIRIIGDLPIYVSLDSADVWAERGMFLLDSDGYPTEVAGVPPDYFSEDGQLWGNPLYDYDAMARDGYGWWIRRIGGAQRLYDVVRIDHFRGFDSFWAIPRGAATAKGGHWCKGPGIALVGTLTGWFHDLDFIAEDLGEASESVQELVRRSGLPGMRVLQFAFDESGKSDHLPHRYTENCVCYTGTHDNPPLRAWQESADTEEVRRARLYAGIGKTDDFCRGMLRLGMGSVARLFIAPMQDWLSLPERMNTPGEQHGNWVWRMLPDALSDELALEIKSITRRYGR